MMNASGSSWLMALGMVLVIEGLLPLVTPAGWREAMRRIAALRDGQIRFVGLLSMLVGLALIGLAA